MAGEKFTVTLSAKIKGFLASMKKANLSIKRMGMQNRGIVKSMQGMSSAAKRSGKALQSAGQKGRTGMDNLDKSTKKTSKTLKKFTIGGIAAAGAIGAIGASVFGLAKLLKQARIGGMIDIQAKAFANLAQSHAANSKTLLKDLKAASKETLSFMEIMTTASRALLLGIESDKLVDLMEIARAASKAMGTTVSEAFSDISLGIGRQSRLILDNLGIIVKVGPAYAAYAASIGTTADALTAFEKKQAFQNAVITAGVENMKRSATGVIDLQDKIARAETFFSDTWARIQAILGGIAMTMAEFFTELGLITGIQVTTDDMINSLGRTLEKFAKTLSKIEKTMGGIKRLGTLGGVLDAMSLFFGGKRGQRLKAKAAAAELIEEQTRQGEKAVSEFGEKSKTWGEKLTEWIDAFHKSATGQADPTRSNLAVALTGVEALNEAFSDINVAPQDLQRQFAQTLPVIERGFKEAAQIASTQSTVINSAFGNIGNVFKQIQTPIKEYTQQLKILKIKQIEVSDEAFIASLGLKSDTQFAKDVDANLSKVNRLLNAPSGLKISDPKRLLEVTNKLLADVRANFNALTKEQKIELGKLNEQLSKIIPVDNIKMGLNQWVDAFNSTSGRMTAIGMQMAEAMSTGFDNFLFDSVMGKITSLEDAFNNMFKSILRQITKFVGEKATQEFMGLAFGATGQQTQSNIGLNFSSLKGLFGGGGGGGGNIGGLASLITGGASKVGGFFKGLFGGGGAQTSIMPAGFPSNPSFGASSLGGFGGILSSLGGGISSLLGFADGGIANFAGAGGSAMVAGSPQLAAIAEKPGKKEAVMPLEKFTDLVQPVNINISAIDTKSFQQYMMDNKESVLGTIMGIKGSRTVDGFQRLQRGPF